MPKFIFRWAGCVPGVVGALVLASCAGPGRKPVQSSLHSIHFDPPVSAPQNPGNVRVKISTATQKLYITEGNRVLMASPCSVGTPATPTPAGTFRAYKKIARKRSGSYGFSIEGGNIRPCKSSQARGRYVGYPMPYWIEFSPAYGIHTGYIKPFPCTHGCVRLPKWAAAKAFALVGTGTPVHVAQSHPEDQTVGKSLPRFDDTTLPDPPAAHIVSENYFQDHVYRGRMF